MAVFEKGWGFQKGEYDFKRGDAIFQTLVRGLGSKNMLESCDRSL